MGVLTINSFWNSTFLSWNLFINERERERERERETQPTASSNSPVCPFFFGSFGNCRFFLLPLFQAQKNDPGHSGDRATSDVIARMYPVKIVEFKNGTGVFYTHSER